MTESGPQPRRRTYDASDFKELMDNAGGWARNWDDVLRYLRGPAQYDADFAKNEVPGMIADIEEVQRKGTPFTTDYRLIWRAITGEDTRNLPPPEGVKRPPTNPLELEGRYFRGLSFPCRKGEILDAAKRNQAPARVMEILLRLKDKSYRDMGSLLEAVGDLTWNHD